MRWLIVISLLGVILGLVQPEREADALWKAPMLAYQPQALVTTRALTPEESKEIFGKDLISRGYIPLEVTIQNKTAKQYTFSSSLDLSTPKEVAREIRKSSLARAFGYKLLGFVFWPLAIPGTVDSVRGHIAHHNVQKELSNKMLKEEDPIEPYSITKGYLYVAGGHPDFYSITLTETGSGRTETSEFLS